MCVTTFLISGTVPVATVWCVCDVFTYLQDAFRDGNVVQLLTRNKGFPIHIRAAAVHGDGAFGSDQSELLR